MEILKINSQNPYSKGFVVNYPDGQSSLERDPQPYVNTPQDIYHTLAESDTLTSLAGHFLGDSRLWWKIADANVIEDPLDLTEYESLLIPMVDNSKSL